MKRNVLSVILALCLVMSLSICASASPAYVQDDAGILSPAELQGLNDMAGQVADTHDFGVYILIVEDYTELTYDSSIEDTIEQVYQERDYGVTSSDSGILLLLSMSDRKYALHAYGDLDDSFEGGHDYLSGGFLDDFGEDQWYQGFEDYITVCDEMLTLGENGESIGRNPPGARLYGIAACILLGLLAAFIVTAVLKSQLTSVSEKNEAEDFMDKSGLNLTQRTDRFTHRTQTRVYDPPEKDSSSSDHSSTSSGSF